MLAKALIAAGGNGQASTLYVDDVFSAYTFKPAADSTPYSINNGVDLTDGGMVWCKARDTFSSPSHLLYDSVRGSSSGDANSLSSNSTNGESAANFDYISSFGASGFSVGFASGGGQLTNSGINYVSWTFRKAPKFFDVQTATLASGNATVNFTDLTTLGMVIVKRTDSTGDWYVWHRSLTAGKLVYLNQTAAEATLGHITVSGTTLTLVDGVLADGNYVCYGFAHDTDATGLIQCGSFTTDGSGNATVTLGWEPQYVMMKNTAGAEDWRVLDSARGWTAPTGVDGQLAPNNSNAENTGADRGSPTATGFTVPSYTSSSTYIYLAIRRPNKPPTLGTQVYNAVARTGTGGTYSNTGAGFTPDMMMSNSRDSYGARAWYDRLRGGSNVVLTRSSGSEFTNTSVTSLDMSGFTGTSSVAYTNDAGQTYLYTYLKRAPGVFDQFCDTGTGANKTETHNLTVAPELWLRKGRSGATEWVWGSSLLANTEKIVMPSPNGKVTDATAWNSTYPTSTSFYVGTAATTNTSSATYTTYLWATLAGVSKVFSYTGDGGSGKVINCGFSTGARFIMIIRTTASTAQDIFIWDSTRGIIAGNDPHISVNTADAEVTTDDSVDSDVSGFAVNQVAATNINVNGAVYVGLAFA